MHRKDLSLDLNPKALKPRGRRIPAPWPSVPCPAQLTQGIPMCYPLELGTPSGTEEGWERACPGELLQEVLQKLRLTSRRAGFGFFSGHQPGLLLRWGRWSCSAGWGGTEPRLAKLGWHGPSLSQMPPQGTAEEGHQGSSLWWWL